MAPTNRRGAKSENALLEEFTKDVENITEQVFLLIKDIQDSKLQFNRVNAELNHLVQNVKEISNIVRNDDSHKGSLLTRIALLEKSVEEVKMYVDRDTLTDMELMTKVVVMEQKILVLERITKDLDKITKNLSEKTNKPTEDSKKKIIEKEPEESGKWKFYVTVATGIFTIIGTVLAVILESGC